MQVKSSRPFAYVVAGRPAIYYGESPALNAVPVAVCFQLKLWPVIQLTPSRLFPAYLDNFIVSHVPLRTEGERLLNAASELIAEGRVYKSTTIRQIRLQTTGTGSYRVRDCCDTRCHVSASR